MNKLLTMVTIINTRTGDAYENRKEAKRKMGHSNYNRALHDGLLMFVTMNPQNETLN